MRRLVVHVGPPTTGTTYFQQALFTNAEVLAAHGIYLPSSARLELTPNSVCHHHLAWDLSGSSRFRPDIGGWDALGTELADVDAETVLLSSELLSPGIFTQGISDLLDGRLQAFGRRVTILYVVRDQLSLINGSYAQKVKTLTDVDAFAPHAAGVMRRGEADFERQTARWYQSPDVDFVAVPITDLDKPNPLVSLLRAAHLPVPDDELVTEPDAPTINLGPIAVEAMRLLRIYLHGLNQSLSHDDIAVRRLHRVAARHAKDMGWCEQPYWGWTPVLSARAAERLSPSNERFAQAVWGSPWPLPLPIDTPPAHVQLLQLASDQLDRVHEYVFAMAKRYATIRSGRPKTRPPDAAGLPVSPREPA